MTVLVTGAAGFLGSHVIDLLLADGQRPRALIRPGDQVNRLERAGLQVCQVDISDAAALAGALRGVDRVLHCAARTGIWGTAADYLGTNVRGLEMLVNAAMAAEVRRFVHVSSITVHGNDVRGSADESAPLRAAINPYSQSKLAAEHLVDRMVRSAGAPVTVVRPGWIYGPRDTASFARLARKIDQGQMVMIGAGSNQLPLVYARDAAQGVLLASEMGQPGRHYLLVNDEPVTQREYLAAIAAELGVPPPGRRIPYRLAVAAGLAAETLWRLARRPEPPPVTSYGVCLLGGDNRFVISRARDELGFTPLVGVAEGVRRGVDWHRASRGVMSQTAVPV